MGLGGVGWGGVCVCVHVCVRACVCLVGVWIRVAGCCTRVDPAGLLPQALLQALPSLLQLIARHQRPPHLHPKPSDTASLLLHAEGPAQSLGHLPPSRSTTLVPNPAPCLIETGLSWGPPTSLDRFSELCSVLQSGLCSVFQSGYNHPPLQGLGKSLTTITFLHTYFKYQQGPLGRAMLVVPANVGGGGISVWSGEGGAVGWSCANVAGTIAQAAGLLGVVVCVVGPLMWKGAALLGMHG